MSMAPNQFGVEQPKKSGKMFWIILILLLVGGCLAVCCGGIALLGWGAVGAIKAPVDAAVAVLNQDATIVDKLGAPIKSGSTFGVENYQNNNGNGGAEVRFNVAGTKGSAEVTGHMDLTANAWRPGNLVVTCSDGTKYFSKGNEFILVLDKP